MYEEGPKKIKINFYLFRLQRPKIDVYCMYLFLFLSIGIIISFDVGYV